MEMKKLILIVNGKPRAGKDTFAEFLGKFIPVYKYSIIEKVKCVALDCGWKGGKTEKDRKFLYELKKLTDEYSNMSFMDIVEKVEAFDKGEIKEDILIIDVRDPYEIDLLANTFGALTVYIQNDNVPEVKSNPADANVDNYDNYDFCLDNNGTIDDFKITVFNFVNILIAMSKAAMGDEDDEEEDDDEC